MSVAILKKHVPDRKARCLVAPYTDVFLLCNNLSTTILPYPTTHRRLVGGSFILIFCLALVLFGAMLVNRNKDNSKNQDIVNPLKANNGDLPTGFLPSDGIDPSPAAVKTKNLTSTAYVVLMKEQKKTPMLRMPGMSAGSPSSGSGTPYPSSAPSGK